MVSWSGCRPWSKELHLSSNHRLLQLCQGDHNFRPCFPTANRGEHCRLLCMDVHTFFCIMLILRIVLWAAYLQSNKHSSSRLSRSQGQPTLKSLLNSSKGNSLRYTSLPTALEDIDF